MSRPDRVDAFQAKAAAYGLRLQYVPADDPQLVDDEIDIYCGPTKSAISIQIGQCGHYYINEHIYKDGHLDAVRHHGEHRSLSVALDRALTLASKDAPYDN